jgi:hypothetical protein
MSKLWANFYWPASKAMQLRGGGDPSQSHDEKLYTTCHESIALHSGLLPDHTLLLGHGHGTPHTLTWRTRPPTCDCASTTNTSLQPDARSICAAYSPEKPAPITMTLWHASTGPGGAAIEAQREAGKCSGGGKRCWQPAGRCHLREQDKCTMMNNMLPHGLWTAIKPARPLRSL